MRGNFGSLHFWEMIALHISSNAQPVSRLIPRGGCWIGTTQSRVVLWFIQAHPTLYYSSLLPSTNRHVRVASYVGRDAIKQQRPGGCRQGFGQAVKVRDRLMIMRSARHQTRRGRFTVERRDPTNASRHLRGMRIVEGEKVHRLDKWDTHFSFLFLATHAWIVRTKSGPSLYMACIESPIHVRIAHTWGQS